MTHFSSFIPASYGVHSTQNAKEATEFLHQHEKISMLMPTVTRIVQLQKDCMAILPAMFEACKVLNFQSEKLIVSSPNAALAAKLKQQLPTLQTGLLNKGWQVNEIRLKVKASGIPEKSTHVKQSILSGPAISALAALGGTLEDSPRNNALKTALNVMLQRHGVMIKTPSSG
jgi:hypothetical protein